MKKVFISVCILFCLSFAAFSLDLQDVDVSQIDLDEVNLSGADFYFQGPMEIYVTGVEYQGTTYAAILDYDGMGTFTVKVPDTVSTAGKPMSIDLADVKLQLTDDGVKLSNLMIDGYDYSGSLAYVPTTDFEIAAFSGKKAEEGTDMAAQKELAAMRKKVNELESQVEEKEQVIAERESMIEEKDQQIADLETKASAEPASETPGMTIVGPAQPTSRRTDITIPEMPTRTILSSIKNPETTYGDWSASGSGVQQSDSQMLDAKFIMDLDQNKNEYLYTFIASSEDAVWTGHGLHFLSSGSEKKGGYGYGSSYLVWVTQDANTQSERPYVQLYKSFNDTWMIELASYQFNGSVTRPIQVDTYVNTDTGLIGVAVNGEIAFAYYDPDPIQSGNTVAFRALNKAKFQSFTVKAE